MKAKIPPEAPILIELGSSRPTETAFDVKEPFEILWVLSKGPDQRCFMRVTIRKTGIYVSHGGGLGGLHTSYHSDGKTWMKLRDEDGNEVTEHVRLNPPLRELKEPIIVENASVSIDDETFDVFNLRMFSAEQRPDSVVFLDTRALTGGLHYQVWAVPPGQLAKVPLYTDWPAHLHVVTHTNPWLMLAVYEQGVRKNERGDVDV